MSKISETLKTLGLADIERRRLVGQSRLELARVRPADRIDQPLDRRTPGASSRRDAGGLRARALLRGRGRAPPGAGSRRPSAARRCDSLAEELRAHKDALGSLVSLENGKIKAEGDGEVQEMIDIADFAVGQSRMLYGLTMHSERGQHRMYEQWHPLGVVGVISAFNFPVAVWSWNAFLAAICGNATVWKPSPKTALCSLAVQHICNRVLERHSLPRDLPDLHRCRHRACRAIRR